jgi:hypothetical protein
MVRKIVLPAVLLALIGSGTAFAQGRPDFSGTWVLDAAKSDMGGGQRPRGSVTIVVKQTSGSLSIERNVGSRPETAVLKLDGSESVNRLPSGAEKKSRARWTGSTLTSDGVANTQGGTAKTQEVWSLSADGKVMTLDVTLQSSTGEKKQKLVYNRQ